MMTSFRLAFGESLSEAVQVSQSSARGSLTFVGFFPSFLSSFPGVDVVVCVTQDSDYWASLLRFAPAFLVDLSLVP